MVASEESSFGLGPRGVLTLVIFFFPLEADSFIFPDNTNFVFNTRCFIEALDGKQTEKPNPMENKTLVQITEKSLRI